MMGPIERRALPFCLWLAVIETRRVRRKEKRGRSNRERREEKRTEQQREEKRKEDGATERKRKEDGAPGRRPAVPSNPLSSLRSLRGKRNCRSLTRRGGLWDTHCWRHALALFGFDCKGQKATPTGACLGVGVRPQAPVQLTVWHGAIEIDWVQVLRNKYPTDGLGKNIQQGWKVWVCMTLEVERETLCSRTALLSTTTSTMPLLSLESAAMLGRVDPGFHRS